VAAEAQLEAASFAYGGVTEHTRSHQCVALPTFRSKGLRRDN
jgi:hypothetical protein